RRTPHGAPASAVLLLAPQRLTWTESRAFRGVTVHDPRARRPEARMALMFLNGDGMRGGRAHYTIEGVPLVGDPPTAPLYRFFSARDEFPALYPTAEGGQPILGELYDVPMGPLSALLATEPPELELSIIELEDGELSFAMVLRESEHVRGIHQDITSYGGWHTSR